MAHTIHLPNSNDVAELRRVLTLIQQPKPLVETKTSTQDKQAGVVTTTSGGVSGAGGGGTVVVGPAGAAGANGSPADLMIGAMEVPEILMDGSGNVLTDENGYALIGVHVESIVLTGVGDTIAAMGV